MSRTCNYRRLEEEENSWETSVPWGRNCKEFWGLTPHPSLNSRWYKEEASGIVTHFEVTVLHKVITTFHPSYSKESRGGHLL